MVSLESLEGVIDGYLWYHYDLSHDVLYLRLLAKMQAETYAEERPDGILVLRTAAEEKAVGLTIVNWWKRFGVGAIPDSLRLLQAQIEPWANKVA